MVVYRSIGWLTLLLLSLALPARAEQFSYYHENVLGTSLELRVLAVDEDAADQAEARVLEEIDRLEAIYSHYAPASELSRFLATPVGHPFTASSELIQALRQCNQCIHFSGGAFHPGVEEFSQLWQRAAAADQLPAQPQLDAIADQLRQPVWQIDASQSTVVRTSQTAISLNAIAKGLILDAAVKVANDQSRGVQGVMLNIGGDLRLAGSISTPILVPNPRYDRLSAPPLVTLNLDRGAIATSGGSERYFEVDGTRYSHVIDPRTGYPVNHVASATVLAGDASTADVLATICTVLSISDSLRLIDSLPGVSCLLCEEDGNIVASEAWPHPAAAMHSVISSTLEDTTGHSMTVEFEIAKPADSRRYRRPYVAVWIEDEEGVAVKTLSLFLMKDNPGPRWHRDLRRWYANDQIRRLADGTDLIATISKPTRNPGNYKISWDGKDDQGKLLPTGKYTLYIEAAREHGTYQLMKQPFELGVSFSTQLKPNTEISSAKVQYEAKQ